jgi:hypothetical protein
MLDPELTATQSNKQLVMNLASYSVLARLFPVIRNEVSPLTVLIVYCDTRNVQTSRTGDIEGVGIVTKCDAGTIQCIRSAIVEDQLGYSYIGATSDLEQVRGPVDDFYLREAAAGHVVDLD